MERFEQDWLVCRPCTWSIYKRQLSLGLCVLKVQALWTLICPLLPFGRSLGMAVALREEEDGWHCVAVFPFGPGLGLT